MLHTSYPSYELDVAKVVEYLGLDYEQVLAYIYSEEDSKKNDEE